METTQQLSKEQITVTCNCCGNTSAKPLPDLSHSLTIPQPSQAVQCTRCDLIFVSPQPTNQELTDYYDEESYYFQAPIVGGLEDAAPHLKTRLAMLGQTLGRKGRFLDVGCALGAFVSYAAEQGWQAEGVDVSHWSTEQARKRGLNVATGTLDAQQYPAASFDVVHSSHMLEHVPDPLSVLREMRRILKPDGLLSLEVPQEVFRLYEQILTRLGTYPAPTEPSPHLFFFTGRTLRRLVTEAGFQIVWLRSRNPVEQWSKSKYPVGNAVKRGIFWLDATTLHGANLELLARPV